jgi:hypothetical protein
MGATSFYCTARGETASEAFAAAQESARYEHGHDGYTGTVAEKSSFRLVDVPRAAREVVQRIRAHDVGDDTWIDLAQTERRYLKAVGSLELRTKRAMAYAYAGVIAELGWYGYENKWGPAVCVQLYPGEYAFLGMASE